MIAASAAAVLQPPDVGAISGPSRTTATSRLVQAVRAVCVTRSPDDPVMARRRSRALLTDAQLVEACAGGDALAWRELVNRYRRLAWGVPRSMGLQPADADEVFQQTFVELLRHLHRIERPERLEAWLVTTARRASLRLLQRERRRVEIAQEAVRRSAANPADVDPVSELEERERVRRAVDGLGDPCRALILGLFADPPRSYRALSRDLGLAVGSLGALRARCLERLRRSLRRAMRASLDSSRPGAGRRS